MEKRLTCGCISSNLINILDRYIAKADKDLENTLKDEGYQKAEELISNINAVEDSIAAALVTEQALIVDEVKRIYEDGNIDTIIEMVEGNDILSENVRDTLRDTFIRTIKSIADAEIKTYDSGLVLNQLSSKTNEWIDSWSMELADLMKLSSYDSMNDILNEALDNGYSIQKVIDKFMDSYSFSRARARTTAITELLTAHSVAAQEAMSQSPAVDRKEWRHTGAHKIEPRKHHQALNGIVIDKNDSYEIISPGGTYKAMFPRDPLLPAAERVNCHCVSRGIVDDSVLGLSLERRMELQREAVSQINDDWEAAIDEKNKAKADINEDTINIDWMKAKSKAGQISYIKGKKKWALVESGVVKNDIELENVKAKTLQELHEDGIITVKSLVINHASKGEYKLQSKQYPKGRLDKGGHSKRCMESLESKRIGYTVTKTYNNGVQIGYVDNHTSKYKNGAVDSKHPNADIGQSWFPESWDDDDILVAATYVANSGSSIVDGVKFDNYNGVRVGIFVETGGSPTTVFPDNMKQPIKDDWEVAR